MNSSFQSKTSLDLEDPKRYHDRILVVGERKFYVVIGILSMWSEYFQTMFNGKFKESTEIKIDLEEVDADVFAIFLKLLYQNYSVEIQFDSLIPLICLSHFYLAPNILAVCMEFIEKNFDDLDILKLDLLKKACIYGMEELKRKLINQLKDKQVLCEFKCLEILELATEYKLDDLKSAAGSYMKDHITYENCSDYLDCCEKFNLGDLKETMSSAIKSLPYWIPTNLIIQLTKAAFRHDVRNLKEKLRQNIFFLAKQYSSGSISICEKDNVYKSSIHTFNWFLHDNQNEIFALPAEISQFIVISTCKRTL